MTEGLSGFVEHVAVVRPIGWRHEQKQRVAINGWLYGEEEPQKEDDHCIAKAAQHRGYRRPRRSHEPTAVGQHRPERRPRGLSVGRSRSLIRRRTRCAVRRKLDAALAQPRQHVMDLFAKRCRKLASLRGDRRSAPHQCGDEDDRHRRAYDGKADAAGPWHGPAEQIRQRDEKGREQYPRENEQEGIADLPQNEDQASGNRRQEDRIADEGSVGSVTLSHPASTDLAPRPSCVSRR